GQAVWSSGCGRSRSSRLRRVRVVESFAIGGSLPARANGSSLPTHVTSSSGMVQRLSETAAGRPGTAARAGPGSGKIPLSSRRRAPTRGDLGDMAGPGTLPPTGPQTAPEPADPFQLPLSPGGRPSGRWRLPEPLRDAGVAVQVIEDDRGRPLSAVIGPDAQHLILPDSAALIPARCDAAWLEYRAPGRFRLLFDEGP